MDICIELYKVNTLFLLSYIHIGSPLCKYVCIYVCTRSSHMYVTLEPKPQAPNPIFIHRCNQGH
jgi:hypothetical protein